MANSYTAPALQKEYQDQHNDRIHPKGECEIPRIQARDYLNKQRCNLQQASWCKNYWKMLLTHLMFQQDSASPHYAQYLDQHLTRQWIGRRGSIEFFFTCSFLHSLYLNFKIKKGSL